MTLTSILGYAPSLQRFERFLAVAGDTEEIRAVRANNQDLVQRIENQVFTVCEEPFFERYMGQTYLDNVLRGGMPVTIGNGPKATRFYTYARQNGDLERDYHWFVLEPTYLSQGNGHYRSILQNRRMDTWFFPEVGRDNITAFMNLIQTDGYNPLVVNGPAYQARDVKEVERSLAARFNDAPWVADMARLTEERSEERRVGKECRSRWSPYH